MFNFSKNKKSFPQNNKSDSSNNNLNNETTMDNNPDIKVFSNDNDQTSFSQETETNGTLNTNSNSDINYGIGDYNNNYDNTSNMVVSDNSNISPSINVPDNNVTDNLSNVSNGANINQTSNKLMVNDKPVQTKTKIKKGFSVVSNYSEDDVNLDDFIGNTNSALAPSNIKHRNKPTKFNKNQIKPIAMNLNSDSNAINVTTSDNKRRAFIIVAVVAAIVILTVAATFFIQANLRTKLASPLKIKDSYVDSAEYSFMYHYILMDTELNVLDKNTLDWLNSPCQEDTSFANNREYYRDKTAKELQRIQILYDDATAHGYKIENKHRLQAESYIKTLDNYADELNVSVDSYISGVFGKQVNKQFVFEFLSKKFFVDDYGFTIKPKELAISEDEANEIYSANPDKYDFVNYKMLRISFEQKDERFIKTANIRANSIIEEINHDPSKFEEVAAQYYSGEEKDYILSDKAHLFHSDRYDTCKYTEFRDWLFAPDRAPGDATIFNDSLGFPLILCFVNRDKQAEPLHFAQVITVKYKPTESSKDIVAENGTDDNPNIYSLAEAQEVSQSIYEKLKTPESIDEIEQLYFDQIKNKSSIKLNRIDTTVYYGQYSGALNDWIFDEEREPGDKIILEGDNCFDVVYYLSVSDNPEWYDRVNKTVADENFNKFMDEKIKEYPYKLIDSGLKYIQDIP